MSRDINNKFWDEELETLPREELEKRQLADLQEIVKFAYENAPYYKRSFDEAGVKPEDIKTLKDIQKFPFINKKTQRDTQGVGSFLGELAAVPEEDVVFISTSSERPLCSCAQLLAVRRRSRRYRRAESRSTLHLGRHAAQRTTPVRPENLSAHRYLDFSVLRVAARRKSSQERH